MIGLILQSRAAVAVLLLAGAPVWCGCPMLMASAQAPATAEARSCGSGCGSEREAPADPSDPCDCDHPAPQQMLAPSGKAVAEADRPATGPAWLTASRPAVAWAPTCPSVGRLDTSAPRGDPTLLSLHTMLTT